MVRPPDQEMAATEKIICCSQFLRGGGTSGFRGPGGSISVSQKAEGEGTAGQELVLWIVVSMGRNRRGRVSGLGWPSLNNFRASGGTGAVSGCLVPGPEATG